MKISHSIVAILAISSLHAQNINLDTLTVTATKIATGTKDISQAIAVVNEQTINDKNILNMNEAIENIPGVQAQSSSNSPSPRLIIRGAGLKARYGVREIMVMKDGVPYTDPDSFTRFDYIDMQDVQSIEVQKGPGSINASNSTGGVIQIVTKSVFDKAKNRIKIGVGDDGQKNLNLKVRGKINENNFMSATFSKRKIENNWRDNNEFDSTQLSIKHGYLFKDDATLESEIAYTESNSNLPTSMTKDEFNIFKKKGQQHNTSNIWQHSARDSKILSFNTKYEKEVGNITYKPRFYMNSWEHYHPITGMINDSDDNKVFGTDLEANYRHKLFNNDAVLVGGLTWKIDKTTDAKKYQYADLTSTSTTSNSKGILANTEDSKTTLYGVYFMESFSPNDTYNIDFSVRADKLSFDIKGNEITEYDWSNPGTYKIGAGEYNVNKNYTLISAKIGTTYKISDYTNAYISIARANQAPTGSEIESAQEDDIDLLKTTSQNYEIGLKSRTLNLSYDLAIYQNDVKDEIIQINNDTNNIVYDNAGNTQKRGLEFNTAYQINKNLELGANYAYSNFKYKDFSESEVTSYFPTKTVVTHNRAGNYLPYIPKNQYSLYVMFKMGNGFKSRITSKSWGSYYMDSANTQKYSGFKFVTDLMLGYERKEHSIQLNIKNITDKYYAMQAEKSLDGDVTYKAAAPRSMMLTYAYSF
jgi:iron complex outermembrane receptor protein